MLEKALELKKEKSIQIENLLYREARLLDDRRYTEWLDMYAEDSIYWVPAGPKAIDEIDPEMEISLIYDTRSLLVQRVKRLNSPYAFTQQPASRTKRLVTNIYFSSYQKNKCEVSAAYCCYELRAKKTNTYVGHSFYSCVLVDNDWKIMKKTIDLLARDEVIDSLSFIL